MTGFTEQLHWIHVSHSLKHNRRCVISNIWKK